MRQSFPDGTPLEPAFGYARAVRPGNQVFVSGTVGWGADGTVDAGAGAYEQTRLAIANIDRALASAGAALTDVVRTRVYTTDITEFDAIARAHREAFAAIQPATSLLEVSRLAGPEMLVEVEADAVITG